MEEWKEVRLDSLVNRKICYGIVQPGFSPKNGIPVIKVNNVVKGLRDVSECDKTTEEISNSYKRTILKGGELIISLVGTVGCIDIAPSSFAGANLVRATGMIDIEDELIKHWVLYYIRTRQGQQYIEENLNTTVQRALNIKDLCKMPIPITSKHYMGRIVSILKSLDDKIEVNRKINENLEQQAQALFKSWFVDFEPFLDKPSGKAERKNGEFVESELGMIPKGWRVEKIGNLPINVTDYVANGSFASLKENVKLYQTPEYAYFIRNTDLKSGNYEVYVDKHSYEFLSKSTLYGGEVIISNVGDVGSVHLCPYLDKPMTLGNNIIMLKPDKQYYSFFLYILFKWAYGNDLIMSIKGGSAQPKFNKTDFKSLKIIVPNDVVLEKYHSIISSLFNKIRVLEDESRRLAELRDTLLPKLMSGELKVNEIEK